jgi:hypothetical protein
MINGFPTNKNMNISNLAVINGSISKNVFFLGMEIVKNKTHQIVVLACLF